MITNPHPKRRSGCPAGVLLTKAEAAEFLGIAPRTLDDWRKAGVIGSIERPGYIRFRQQDLEDFLERYRREPKTASPFRPRVTVQARLSEDGSINGQIESLTPRHTP